MGPFTAVLLRVSAVMAWIASTKVGAPSDCPIWLYLACFLFLRSRASTEEAAGLDACDTWALRDWIEAGRVEASFWWRYWR